MNTSVNFTSHIHVRRTYNDLSNTFLCNLGLQVMQVTHSLVPRPHPASRHFQYGKAGRAWYLFSHEHDVIGKFSEQTGYCSTDYMLNARYIRQSPSISQKRAVSYLLRWLFLVFWALRTHGQLNSFYHPFHPDVTHVRKDTRPSPRFSALIATESWAGPGNEAR